MVAEGKEGLLDLASNIMTSINGSPSQSGRNQGPLWFGLGADNIRFFAREDSTSRGTSCHGSVNTR
jgi:hypothetical protein